MANIVIDALRQLPVEQQRIELVERKGIGHLDTMCDAILEQISLALCQAYLTTYGRVLHYNIDKGLLIAGRTAPHLGGDVWHRHRGDGVDRGLWDPDADDPPLTWSRAGCTKGTPANLPKRGAPKDVRLQYLKAGNMVLPAMAARRYMESRSPTDVFTDVCA